MRKKGTTETYHELQHALRQQELVSEIALGMITLEDFSVRVNRALQQAGEHTGVSRVYIFEDSADGVTCSNAYEWCNNGIEPQMEQLQAFPYSSIPSWKRIMRQRGRIYSDNIDALPGDLRAALAPQGIRSIVVYPLFVKQHYSGFIGFDECIRVKQWSRQELELLRTVSGIIAGLYERRQMEESLRCERDRATDANRAKDLFLANMSHEIRSPMNLVLGFSQVLMKELPDPEQREMVRSIVTSGNLLLSLLNDLLDLSKAGAGRLEILPHPVTFARMMEDVGSLFGLKAEQKGLEFGVSVSDAVPQELLLDEVRVKQVIFNLLGNAIKFTSAGRVDLTVEYSVGGQAPAGRHVCSPDVPDNAGQAPAGRHVCSPDATDNAGQAPAGRHVCSPDVPDNAGQAPAGHHVCSLRYKDKYTGVLQIKVSDSGIGIPPEETKHIFEPFVQAEGVAGSGYGGTGLGLSICKRLAEQMGGTVEVSSRVGEGSVFTITIPCSVPETLQNY